KQGPALSAIGRESRRIGAHAHFGTSATSCRRAPPPSIELDYGYRAGVEDHAARRAARCGSATPAANLASGQQRAGERTSGDDLDGCAAAQVDRDRRRLVVADGVLIAAAESTQVSLAPAVNGACVRHRAGVLRTRI